MKVLFDCPVPFSLAHGGHQIQIEQTQAALEMIGLTIEPLRWWDSNQTGEILHYFGRTPLHLLNSARQKGMKVVTADLLTGQGSRPEWRHTLQRVAFSLLERVLPASSQASLSWRSYRQADACVALTRWEAHLLAKLYGAPPSKIH